MSLGVQAIFVACVRKVSSAPYESVGVELLAKEIGRGKIIRKGLLFFGGKRSLESAFLKLR